MKQTKVFRHTLPILAMGLLFTSFRTTGEKDTNRINTLRQIIKRISSEHVQPKPLDDKFSTSVWSKHLHSQDPHKLLYLQQDIEQLRVWEQKIDDELKAPSIGFFQQSNNLLTSRIQEVIPLFKQLLSKPMDFSRNETTVVSATWPSTEKERMKAWERHLKLLVLQKVMDLQTNKNTLSFVAAEKEARQKVLALLEGSYKNLIGESAADQRFASFVNTVVMEIDPHTLYYAPAENRERDARMGHRYFGVGLELLAQEGEIRIKRVLPGGSADRSGLLKPNDHIIGIGGTGGAIVPVSGFSVPDVSQLVRGDSGTVLRMLVSRAGREEEVKLIRGVIHDNTNAAKSAFIEKNGKTFGYIRLPEFYRDLSRPDGAQCAIDVAKAVELLKQENIAGIIIDLRGNGGGSLEEVQKMAGIFLPVGPVAQGRFRDKNTRFDMFTWKDVLYDGPLTIMIDENSASASEMFAGAMQDYGRAVIVGSASSFGKGTMQETRLMGKMGNKELGTPNVSYGSLSITLGRFYRITGASTQLNGIKPDVVFPTKGEWNGFREKNFPTAFVPDTMEAAYFERSKHAVTLAAPIEAARLRVKQDTGFAVIRRNVDWLIAHATDPQPLKLDAFKRAAAEKAMHEKQLDAAGRLPGTACLGVRAAESAGPDSPEAGRQQEWLESIRGDRYLFHTLDVVRDLAR